MTTVLHHLLRMSRLIAATILCVLLVPTSSWARWLIDDGVMAPVVRAEEQPLTRGVSGAWLDIPTAVQFGQAGSLQVQITNLESTPLLVTVTIPEIKAKSIGNPQPPEPDALGLAVGALKTDAWATAWVPTGVGYTHVVLDLWLARDLTVHPIADPTLAHTCAQSDDADELNSVQFPADQVQTDHLGLQPLNAVQAWHNGLTGNAVLTEEWLYAGRLTGRMLVHPAGTAQVVVDAAHQNAVTGTLTYTGLQQPELWLHLGGVAWSSETLADTAVLWVDISHTTLTSLFSAAELAAVAKHVTSGGAVVVTNSTASDSSAHLANALLAAIGVKSRLLPQIELADSPADAAGVQIPAHVVSAAQPEELRPILLVDPHSIAPAGTHWVLLQTTLEPATPTALGVLEQVGKGWVAILGAPLFSSGDFDLSPYDNHAFGQALVGWLAEQVAGK